MSLVNYIEPTNIGNALSGVGELVISLVMAYIIYRVYLKFCQWLEVIINRASKYEILEEAYLDKLAQRKGVDLNKELIRRKMLDEDKKSLRKKIEDEIYNDMFGGKKNER